MQRAIGPRGCGQPMRMIGLGTYRCDACDITEERTLQREVAIRFGSVQEAFLHRWKQSRQNTIWCIRLRSPLPLVVMNGGCVSG